LKKGRSSSNGLKEKKKFRQKTGETDEHGRLIKKYGNPKTGRKNLI